MSDKSLRVVEDAPRDSAVIHVPPKGKMAFSGDGPDRLLCGNCGQPLAEGASQGDLFGAFIQCPECGSLNGLEH